MAGGESNDALLALQKYRAYVAGRRDAGVTMWQNPPPPVMLAYGAVVLTAGVLFSALGQWSKLKGFMWGSGLAAVLDLSVAGGVVIMTTEERGKIAGVLAEVAQKIGLGESTGEEFRNLFLELVQWELIFAVNGDLSEKMRVHLAEVLKAEGSETDRSKTILQFLADVGVDAFKAKKYVDSAVSLALTGMVKVFESRGYRVADLVTTVR